MREFDNIAAIKLVYMAVVRSKLESASLVWNPTLRGESDCPEIVSRVVRLSVPRLLTHQLRPRQHPLLAVPEARTVAHANSPLVRVLTMLNSLLTSAPECDLFALRWIDVCRECLRFCERMDVR
ncbi:hypothetical protein SFRURICE_019580 [Spodoptera frugiperda]|nr:hypothetical protein SFRURICE_019580 [Spodoptera frugiperda]